MRFVYILTSGPERENNQQYDYHLNISGDDDKIWRFPDSRTHYIQCDDGSSQLNNNSIIIIIIIIIVVLSLLHLRHRCV